MTEFNAADAHNEATARELARLARLTNLLDSAVSIPGTPIRLGLDSLVGLIPGIGDATTALASSYLVYRAHRLGVPRWTLAKMLGNVGIDMVVGAVPLVGDLFDATWKCNTRNLRLLERSLSPTDTIDSKLANKPRDAA